jgi:GNAT superfamily N-acetyltransferase
MSDRQPEQQPFGPPRDDLAPASLIEAIEANTREFLLALGRAGGGEERDDPNLHWVIGGSPLAYHNCVIRASLTPASVDPAIAASLERLRASGAPGSWHVGPSMQPADLGKRLVAQGFTYAGDEPGMAMNLHELREDLPSPDGVRIERVRDAEGIATWAATLAANEFGEGERESRWIGAMYRRIGLGDDVPWRHFLAWRDDTPVATTTLFLGAGAAGIYFVSTPPQLRRQGIGAAITLAALRAASELGFRVAVLGASALGHPLYRRLGFVDYCRLSLYEWQPTSA